MYRFEIYLNGSWHSNLTVFCRLRLHSFSIAVHLFVSAKRMYAGLPVLKPPRRSKVGVVLPWNLPESRCGRAGSIAAPSHGLRSGLIALIQFSASLFFQPCVAVQIGRDRRSLVIQLGRRQLTGHHCRRNPHRLSSCCQDTVPKSEACRWTIMTWTNHSGAP